MLDHNRHWKVCMAEQGNHARLHVVLILILVGLMSAAAMLLGPARRTAAPTTAGRWSFNAYRAR